MHSEEKAYSDIQKRLCYMYNFRNASKRVQTRVYTSVREYSLRQLADIADLSEDSVWRFYYLNNMSIRDIEDKLQCSTAHVKLMLKVECGVIAEAILRSEE